VHEQLPTGERPKLDESQIRREAEENLEMDVMSMSAEDRIMSLGRKSKAGRLPPVGAIIGVEERKHNIDSEREVMSMTAEDRIKSEMLRVGKGAGVSKSVQFQDRTPSTDNPRMLSEVWPTKEKHVLRNDIPGEKVESMSANDMILLQHLEVEISRAQKGFRLTKSAMGPWTKNKQKGWELIRRAEKIGSNKQGKAKTRKIKRL
jgi:hypothetical protein